LDVAPCKKTKPQKPKTPTIPNNLEYATNFKNNVMQATKLSVWKEVRKQKFDIFNLSENLHIEPMLLWVSFNRSVTP
jgi:hypothetical protein